MSRKCRNKSNEINNKGNRNKVVQDVNAQNVDLSEKAIIENAKNTVYNSDIKAKLVHIGDRFEIHYDSGKIIKSISVLDFFSEKSTKDKNKLVYQDYLDENILPYVKRSDFKKREYTPDNFIDENDIVEKLNIKLGSIIIGRGGTGKTRTMYEVGKLAHKQNWQTLVIQPNFTEVDFLLSNLKSDNKYLLVFDYIEESESFANVVKYIVENKRDEQIKILANCRKSYYENLKTQLYTSQHLFAIFDFTNKDTQTSEAAYQNFVSKRITSPILQKAKLKQNKRNAFFKLRSSFAVFLRFLHDKGDRNLNLHQLDSFEAWLLKRFKLTLGVDNFNIDIIKQLLLLPVFGDEVDDYLDKYEINEKLITDGWLQEIEQYDTERLDTVHDTVKDELLLYYLHKEKETERKLGRQIKKHLQFANENNGLKNWFRAYERIINEPVFTDYPDFFYSFFYKNLKNENFPEFDSYILIKSALLTEKQKFDLISEKSSFFNDFIISENFALPLAYALNFYSKDKNSNKTPTSLQLLADNWIKKNPDFSKNGLIADRIISTYLKKYGLNNIIKTHLEKFVKEADNTCGNFTIAAWLYQTGDTVFIKQYLEQYLQENIIKEESIFVLKAWLRINGDMEFIKPYLDEFLKANATEKEASYILKAWIDKNGDMEFIKPHLDEFLKANATVKEASFILQAWIDKNGDKEFIKKHLEIHLTENATDKEASFILQAWLEQKGDKEFIRKYLEEYLNINAPDRASGVVLKSWIKGTKDTKFVQKHIEEYLKANVNDKEAMLVFNTWLKKDGDKAIVKEYLIEYLNVNAKDEEAWIVFHAWLKKGGDKELVKNYLLKYLSVNAKCKKAGRVFKAWLDKNGDIYLIKIYLVVFFNENAKDKKTGLVFNSWLNHNGDKEFVKKYLIVFFNENAKDVNAGLVFSAWLNKNGAVDFIRPFIYTFLEIHSPYERTSFVYQAYLKKANWDKDNLKPYLTRWLTIHSADNNTKYLLSLWLRKINDNEFIKPFLIKWLNKNQNDDFEPLLVEQWIENGGDYNEL